MIKKHTALFMSIVLFPLFALPAQNTGAQEDYKKPKPFAFITQIPKDIADYGKDTFRKENTGAIALMAAGTGLLIITDQYWVDKARNLGNHLGISHTNYKKTFQAYLRFSATNFYYKGLVSWNRWNRKTLLRDIR